ncbi:hypothetical protein QE152_g38527 [Popillia japonica]|uniref:Uncharacterized protein n=1 Tax=Popillia japonica TaxID=7064 RepID=A0AAW1HWG7_POPJA
MPVVGLGTYKISLGMVVIPKSVTKSRIIENIDVFDFQLSAEELAYLDSSLLIGYLVYDQVEKLHHKYMLKNPADYENDK